jgi:hypothetical protein
MPRHSCCKVFLHLRLLHLLLQVLRLTPGLLALLLMLLGTCQHVSSSTLLRLMPLHRLRLLALLALLLPLHLGPARHHGPRHVPPLQRQRTQAPHKRAHMEVVFKGMPGDAHMQVAGELGWRGGVQLQHPARLQAQPKAGLQLLLQQLQQQVHQRVAVKACRGGG